ncbi:MAG TPA: tetratricopeptide repeat protein, partial [Roseivirga sp.]
LKKYKEVGIQVFICTLVSNVKDFEPFESAEGEFSALAEFKQGRDLLKEEPSLAKNKLALARDYDLLKFRAPSAIEDAIHELSKENNITLIDVKTAFESSSEYNIVGNELLLEHVHPNLNGQRLLANSVFNGIKEWMNAQGINDNPQGPFKYLTSEVDSVFGHTLLNQLLNNWPFTDKADSGIVPAASNDIERMITGELPWVAVMNSTYTKQITTNPTDAVKTAKVLLQEYPHQVQPYLMLGEALSKAGRYDEAEVFLNSVPPKLTNVEVTSLRLSNLLSNNAFEQALPIARKLLMQQNIPQNEYTIKAISDILKIDFNQIDRVEVLNDPNKFIAALGALFYLKKNALARSYYDQLVRIIPQNSELQQLAKTIQLK